MRPAPKVVREYSPRLAAWFGTWLEGYFARNFDAVRTSGRLRCPAGLPLVVYSNHPSWWDPIHFLLLSRQVAPERRMFGPFEAAALQQYGFFRRIGGFGIDSHKRRGAADFLRISQGILETPDTMLWITAQGEFSDPRRRPVELRPGLAHLIRRLGHCMVVPLAIEYPFWNERRPQALSAFGAPLQIDHGRSRSVDAWQRDLENALADTMDSLADLAARREPEDFDTLVLGRTGIGGVYDLWRQLAALVQGRRFRASHQAERR